MFLPDIACLTAYCMASKGLMFYLNLGQGSTGLRVAHTGAL